MSIIALLLTIGLSFYGNAQRATRDAKRRGDLDAIRKSAEIYKTEKGTYAIATTFPCVMGVAGAWGFSDSNFGAHGSRTGCPASVKNGLGSYFVNSEVPKDPYCSASDDSCTSGWTNYDYTTNAASDSFVIYAELENAPTTPCAGAPAPYNYCVKSQN